MPILANTNVKIKKFKHKGKFVYEYTGHTYGVIDWRTEIPTTKKPNELPFLGRPIKELKEVGFVEIQDKLNVGKSLSARIPPVPKDWNDPKDVARYEKAMDERRKSRLDQGRLND